MSARRIWSGGLVVSLAGVLALTACSAGEPQGPPTLTAAEATQEYLTEAGQLTLAPDSSWPSQPIAGTAEDGIPMIYEPGFGRQAADSFWFCSWSGRALDVAVTESDRQAAIAELDKIRTTYFYTKALAPESRPILDKVLDSTRLGDLTPLRNDHEMNCPHEDGT
ncbi:hypothetical protein [Intrasporangium sp.]|uniref:hypothetical protein n=1 Tax=Intrasporangium sp. TaxID=1925024 RepID=UPI0032216A62